MTDLNAVAANNPNKVMPMPNKSATTCSAVGAGNAGDATSSPSKFFWQNWFDLGKIKAKLGQN